MFFALSFPNLIFFLTVYSDTPKIFEISSVVYVFSSLVESVAPTALARLATPIVADGIAAAATSGAEITASTAPAAIATADLPTDLNIDGIIMCRSSCFWL